MPNYGYENDVLYRDDHHQAETNTDQGLPQAIDDPDQAG